MSDQSETTADDTVRYDTGRFEEMLGDRTRIRLIKFLSLNRDVEPHRQKTISDAIGVSKAMISRESDRLESVGLVEKDAEGMVLVNNDPSIDTLVEFVTTLHAGDDRV